MSRAVGSKAWEKILRAKRDAAIGRPELRQPSTPRAWSPGMGATASPLKTVDDATRQAIAAYEAHKANQEAARGEEGK